MHKNVDTAVFFFFSSKKKSNNETRKNPVHVTSAQRHNFPCTGAAEFRFGGLPHNYPYRSAPSPPPAATVARRAHKFPSLFRRARENCPRIQRRDAPRTRGPAVTISPELQESVNVSAPSPEGNRNEFRGRRFYLGRGAERVDLGRRGM